MEGVNRKEGPTPHGGDYVEIAYLDVAGRRTDERRACRYVIQECKEDGRLVYETWGVLQHPERMPLWARVVLVVVQVLALFAILYLLSRGMA